MRKQEAYDKGYAGGQQLYAERPNMDRLAQISWAGTEAICENIPMAKYGDYQSGYLDGYAAAKQQDRVKQ